MKRRNLVLNIDRLVLSGMDLNPDQAQRLRLQLIEALQNQLDWREVSIRPMDAGRLELPPLSPAEVADSSRLVQVLAQQLADSLTGGLPTSGAPVSHGPVTEGRPDNG